MARFTNKQGQYLAYIHLYRKLHRQGPSEANMVQYFLVSPPSVHQMIVKLEQSGLISREPGVPRSARVAIAIGDDTSMALALAGSIAASGWDINDQARRYVA